MSFEILDPTDFLKEGIFREDDFIEKAQSYNWEQFKDKKVLVRGCNSAIFPPWAFMMIGAKLVNSARSVRYGNEHNNVVVYREKK